MSIELRLILLISSVMAGIYISAKLKKSQVQITDTVFWLFTSCIFIIMALFPQIPQCISGLLGFEAPVNFIFLTVISVVFIRCFLLSIRVSQLDEKIKNLTEELALRDAERNE